MNEARRACIEAIRTKIEELIGELAEIQSEEEEYRDNMPENLQGSERYENADAACTSLESAGCSLQEALDTLEEALQ